MEYEKKLVLQLASSPDFFLKLYDRDFRQYTESLGLHVTRANFYSSLPTIDDLDFHYDRPGEEVLYDHPSVFQLDTIKKSFAQFSPYGDEFIDLCSQGKMLGFLDNDQFYHCDPVAYYSIVRWCKPSTIFEIGSGYSTMVASEALKANGLGNSRIIANEPYPRDFLYSMENTEVRKVKAQTISADQLNSELEDGDILFIDSTHTVKEGSDVLHLICEVLPRIKKKLLVHFHDIWLPFSFPKTWVYDGLNWEEQYLLYAYLLNNGATEVIYGTNYLVKNLETEMTQFTVGQVGGSSFWFKIK